MVNYHNMDTERKKIAPEAVDVRDFLNLVRWFAALAESPIKMEFDGGRSGLGKRLDGLRRKYSRRLERSPQISQIAQK
jgi:hypothetical protein